MTPLTTCSPTQAVLMTWHLVNGVLLICSIVGSFQLWLTLLGNPWPRYAEAPLICYVTAVGVWLGGCALFWRSRIKVSIYLCGAFLIGFLCGIPLMPLYQSRLDRVIGEIRNGHIMLYGPTVPTLCGGVTAGLISVLWRRHGKASCGISPNWGQ